MSDDQTIRERAYHLWQEAGCPDGQADEFWDRARFLIGIAENPQAGTLPNPSRPTVQNPQGTAPTNNVEPIEAVENLGEFPAWADKGKNNSRPSGPSVRSKPSQ
jgi:hypothetical protein